MELWPDSDPEPRRESLVSQLLAGLRARETRSEARPPHGWRVAALAGLLIAAGPMALWIGASLSVASVEAQNAKLRALLAPRFSSEKRDRVARDDLANMVARPVPGSVLEALARALPTDAGLVRVGMTAQGLIEIEANAPDPDRLRAALRREMMFKALRVTGQARGDGTMIVTFSGPLR